VSRSQPQEHESQTQMPSSSEVSAAEKGGSLDGVGAADHDQPYRFGWRPRSSVPYPFSTRQYSRLLVLRSRVQNGLLGADDVAA
jgi:hypothetical protein